jgi:S1-C subfamily serine protease
MLPALTEIVTNLVSLRLEPSTTAAILGARRAHPAAPLGAAREPAEARRRSARQAMLLANKIAAVFLLIGMVLHNFAAQAEDATYAKIGWWSVEYVHGEDWVGCQATASFKGQTLLSMVLVHTAEGKGWLITISNPAWKSWIKKKKQHTLRLVTTKTWQGTFFVTEDGEELYSSDLSIEFMNSIADAKTLGIFNEKNKSLASLDMKDSTNAIKAVVNCAREHAMEVAEALTAPEQTTFSGTGFFVAPNLFMTNKHVVAGCSTIDVRYPDQTPHTATIAGQDSTNDLALLRTDMSGESVASFRLGPRLGEAVATYGFPYHGILSSSGNFTLGNITSMTGMGDDSRFFQMSTPIQPGNSGGPLLDMSGAVVGVVVAQLSAVNMMIAGSSVPQNVNFAIHAPVATNFLSIKGVEPKLLDTSSAAPQALSPADVADMAKNSLCRLFVREHLLKWQRERCLWPWLHI